MAKLSRINARQAAAMVEMAEKQGSVDERLERIQAKLDEALEKIDALTELVAALVPAEETPAPEAGASKSRKAKSEE